MRLPVILTFAAITAAAFTAPVAAAIIVHEDTGGSFRTNRSGDSAPVGDLIVSSSQTITGFGIDVQLNAASDLTFYIFNADTGTALYTSGPTAFTDLTAGYKYSDAFSFTFNPGTTYALTASSSSGGQFFVDTVANTVGAFTFLVGNQNVQGGVLNANHNCCDVGTALVTTDGVPEPASWALLVAGFGMVGASVRRSRRLALA